MIYSYPGCFFQRPDGKYCVVFADLNNLVAFGDDFDKTLANGVELLARYIYNLIIKNQPVPIPSDITKLKPNVGDQYTRAFLKIINVDVEEYVKYHFVKNVNRTVSVAKWLDDFAVKQDIDLSKIVNDVLLEKYRSVQNANK